MFIRSRRKASACCVCVWGGGGSRRGPRPKSSRRESAPRAGGGRGLRRAGAARTRVVDVGERAARKGGLGDVARLPEARDDGHGVHLLRNQLLRLAQELARKDDDARGAVADLRGRGRGGGGGRVSRPPWGAAAAAAAAMVAGASAGPRGAGGGRAGPAGRTSSSCTLLMSAQGARRGRGEGVAQVSGCPRQGVAVAACRTVGRRRPPPAAAHAPPPHPHPPRLTHEDLGRGVVHVDGLEDGRAVVSHGHLLAAPHALRARARARARGRVGGRRARGRGVRAAPAGQGRARRCAARVLGARRGGRGGRVRARHACRILSIPLGPSVLFTRSATAMAPTNAAWGGGRGGRCGGVGPGQSTRTLARACRRACRRAATRWRARGQAGGPPLPRTQRRWRRVCRGRRACAAAVAGQGVPTRPRPRARCAPHHARVLATLLRRALAQHAGAAALRGGGARAVIGRPRRSAPHGGAPTRRLARGGPA